MLPYNVNRQRRKPKSNARNKPKIMYTDDGFAVTTLYLKNVGKEMKREHLLNHFSTFGKVQNVRIHTKPAVSFGFVTFAREESAAKALDKRVHKIMGRVIIVAMADSWHQEKPLELSNNHKSAAAKSRKAAKVPIELTNETGTHLLSLPDDCLYEMFSLKLVNLMDLCALAESCTRLKEIASRIFATSHKICDLRGMFLKTIYETRRVLINFGPSIIELTLSSSFIYDELPTRVLDLVIRFCSKTLESLKLSDYEITNLLTGKLRPLFSTLQKLHVENLYICGDGGKQLFANCKSLVELTVIDLQNGVDVRIIFENYFPKLERFEYQSVSDDYDDYNLELFLTRHRGLTAFCMKEFQSDCSSLLPMIAANCKDLEKLQITGHDDDCSFSNVDALMSLLTLKKLTELKMKCDDAVVTKFIQELPQLSSLEFLELWHAQSDTEFVPALAQLKDMSVLRLRQCQKNLTIGMNTFKLDKRMYLKIVDVVRQRSTIGRLPSPLEICLYNIEDDVTDLQNDGKNMKIVKLSKLHYNGGGDYSDSDSDIDFGDDDDSDDSDDSFNWNHADLLLPFFPPQLLFLLS